MEKVEPLADLILNNQEAIKEFESLSDAGLSSLANELIDCQLKVQVYKERLSKIIAQRGDSSNPTSLQTPQWDAMQI